MNTQKSFSIIVPCLNEEKYIGKLLHTLAKQTDQDFELFVVDGKSEDKTVEIINQYKTQLPQLTLIISDRRGVSYQRNLGAASAQSEHLLFLDADSRLDADYVKDFKEEQYKCAADIATAYIWPDSTNPLDWFFWLGGNLVIDLSRFTWPFAPGMNLYLRKEIFDKAGGFDTEIKVGEDTDLVKRASAIGGKFVVLKKPKYFTDVRRLKTEGHFGYLVKLMLIAWQAHRRGGFENVSIEYRMGDWDDYEREKRSLFDRVKEVMIFWK